MASNADILRTANLLIEEYGEMAPMGAIIRADHLSEQGDFVGHATWLGIAKLVEDIASIVEELAYPQASDIPDQGLSETSSRTRQETSPTQNADLFSRGVSDSHQFAQPRESEIFPCQLSSDERALLHQMGFEPLPADLLASRSGMPIERVTKMLAGLEL